QIDEEAKVWQEGKKELLRGVDLEIAEKYLTMHLERVPLSEEGQKFVQKSRQEHDRILKEEKERQERELGTERRQKWTYFILFVLTITATIATGLSWMDSQEKKARAEMNELRSQALLASRSPDATRNYDTALLLATKILKGNGNNLENRDTLLRVLQGNPELKTYLWGNNGKVTSMAINRHNELVATYETGDMILWNIKDFSSHTLPGKYSDVTSLSFHPQKDSLLAVGDRSGNVVLLDITDANAKGLKNLETVQHKKGVTSIMFSPDGEWLATGSRDETVRLHSMDNLKEICLKHEGIVRSVTFQKDQLFSLEYSSTNGSRLLAWDIESIRSQDSKVCLDQPKIIKWQDPNKFAIDIAIDPQGVAFALSTAEEIMIWDLREQREDREFFNEKVLGNEYSSERHSGWITDITFNADGDKLISASFDTTLKVWDFRREHVSLVLTGHKDAVINIVAQPTVNQLFSSSWDGSIISWDIDALPQSPLMEYLGSERKSVLENLLFYAQNTIIFSEEYSVKSFNIDTREEKEFWTVEGNNNISNLILNDTSLIVIDQKNISFIDVLTGKKLDTIDIEEGTKKATISPDKKWLATLGKDDVLTLSEVDNEENFSYTDNAESAFFSNDSKYLIITNANNSIELRTSESQFAQSKKLGEHEDKVNVVVFDKTGKFVATAGDDRIIKIWHLLSESDPIELKGHTDGVVGLAFNPNTSDGWVEIASISKDRTLRIWNVSSGKSIGEPFSLGACCSVEKNAVVFSSDGKRLFSLLKEDNKYDIIILDNDPHSWQKKACSIVNRDFTLVEWKTYFAEEDHQESVCGNLSP
ncbi:MAG: hypothetical protein BWK78_02705, partial [Thiotrichaceae bacterium IS1]